MGYRKTYLANGQYYHIYNRGVAKQPIFQESVDYIRLMDLIEYYRFANPPLRFSHYKRLPSDKKKETWDRFLKSAKPLIEIYAYCFMPNHFHLLIKQNIDKGISKFMASSLNSYSRYFNTKRKRVGPLFQANFKAVRIENDEQLVHLNRYIHLNPVTSYLVKRGELKGYPWSSLPFYLGERPNNFINTNIILQYFRSKKKFLEFLTDQINYQRELERIKHLILEE